LNISNEFIQTTSPWSFAADGLPTLKGRRFDHSGRPLIHFMHGNGFCGAIYWNFLRHFRDGYGLFLHDVQGHGDSEAGAGFPGWKATVARTATLIQQHPVTRSQLPLIGMGHSFGAAVTLMTAARHPELFRCLVLVDPVLFPPGLKRVLRYFPGLNPIVRKARTRTQHWPTREAAWGYLHQRGIFRGIEDDALACYIDHGLEHREDGLHLKCPREVETQIFSSMPMGLWAAVKAVRCPVYILHGRDSYPFVAQGAARAARINPRFTIQSQAGGHCFMLEHPRKAHENVDAYLRGLAGSR
jgi:pimeloyl-ACP methyl ester carboxylesterase